MKDDDLKIFSNFLKLALRRSGDETGLFSIPLQIGVTGPRKIDLLNRLILIFMDIPVKLFPDEEVRITLLEDYRRMICESTMEEELGEEYVEPNMEVDFDDVMDLFDLD